MDYHNLLQGMINDRRKTDDHGLLSTVYVMGNWVWGICVLVRQRALVAERRSECGPPRRGQGQLSGAVFCFEVLFG